MSEYSDHVARWSNCTECPLCENRKKVVLGRGTLPCDVLFIGEAPGKSEDVLGQPFVGPAGQLLNLIVEDAQVRAETALKVAYTNLIACIPLDESDNKISEPPAESIKACNPRLTELVLMARPDLIVCVGSHAAKWVPKYFGYDHAQNFVTIIHPAAILRLDISQKGLAIQRTVVTLADAFIEL